MANPTRTYTADEIQELVDIMRNGGDLSDEELAGINKVVAILKEFENMSDAGIMEKVQGLLRSGSLLG